MHDGMPDPVDLEKFLQERHRWVSSAEICEHFRLSDDRPFRRINGRPGLMADFAISGNRGFKHVDFATDAAAASATTPSRSCAASRPSDNAASAT